ncbi:MAG: nucleotide sugar dehydrogenase, partial [Clostridium sulfidigenes]|nr:nucleotide sugar dehydrogenase [Clostridium sulfidigenes]
ANKRVKNAKVAVLGLTFKEDCPDTRNTKVVDIIDELKDYGVNVLATDPVASKEEIKHEYGIDMVSMEDIKDVDAIILAVSHHNYREMTIKDFTPLYRSEALDEVAAAKDEVEKDVFIDVKGIMDRHSVDTDTMVYWRL